jgi:hypothetical protein
MSESEKPSAAVEADPEEADESAETVSPLGREVQARINAAVQAADVDETQGTESAAGD